MASRFTSEYASESEYGSLLGLGLHLGVICSGSGMTLFSFLAGAVSVGEQCTLNIEIHTWLDSHGLIV